MSAEDKITELKELI